MEPTVVVNGERFPNAELMGIVEQDTAEGRLLSYQKLQELENRWQKSFSHGFYFYPNEVEECSQKYREYGDHRSLVDGDLFGYYLAIFA